MAIVSLGPPPNLEPGHYSTYRPWLSGAFYRDFCSYCLLSGRSPQIDHYEPKTYRPEREHDPTNLLLACAACNGRSGKSDYHPDHVGRTRYKKDETGYLVLDIRVDDFAQMFVLRPDGSLEPIGADADRAAWNIGLLGLRKWNRSRRDMLRLVAAAEAAIRTTPPTLEVIDYVLPAMKASLLFFDTFGIAVSPELRALLEPMPRD